MYADWINFGITFLIVSASLLLVTELLMALFLRIARRTKSSYDEAYLLSIRRYVRWLVVVISLYFATNRLLFLPPTILELLHRLYFGAIILIIAVVVWLLVDHLVWWYQELAQRAGKKEPKEAALQLLQRAGHILVVILSGFSILDRFGVNITALLATLGIGGLAISLATQDSLSNMVSGILLMVDQPFRIGDRIEIQGLNAWGEVMDIGLRSTRIRMGDNRMVIIPNSNISRNFVINYSYPDPRFRQQVNVKVNYVADLDALRELISGAVRSVEGVLVDQPVEVVVSEITELALSLRVRWWSATYSDSRSGINRVNDAIYRALKEAKILTT